MRIVRLHIENFGKLHDLDMEFQEGLQVIRRDNGWGKSTLAAFIKAMFYGLPGTSRRSLKENERKHYLPWQGGPFGGSMEFLTEDGAYRVERFFGSKEREDRFTLYDLNTGLESADYSDRLGEELFGVDRAAYGRSSFLGQQDMYVSMNDSLNARLTHVEEDAGDMRNYEQAVSSLEDQMKYYRKTGNRGQIGKLEEERRNVRDQLLQCEEKEAKIGKLRSSLHSLALRAEEEKSSVEAAEKELWQAQSYRQLEAKKAQYDLLRNRAEEKREELQETAALLAEYTDALPGEEELDRCREWIFQLDGLGQKEQEANRQAKEAVSRLGDAEDARGALSSSGMSFGALGGCFLVLGVFFLFRGWYAAGAVFLAGGAGALLLGYQRNRIYHGELERLERQIQENGRRVRDTERLLRDLQKKQDALEKKICGFLGLESHASMEEMERQWKDEWKRYREYTDLQQKYELLRKEASGSRELWFQYGESFSEEERALLHAPVKAESDIQAWRQKLETCKARRNELEKEQEELRYRIRGLQEYAERIPELQEREAFLSEEIREAVREHGILEQTVQYLKKAREQFSIRYVRELQSGLEFYAAELEPGRKAGISVDTGLQIRLQEAGSWRDLEYQSAGKQDLLLFAERMAMLDVLYSREQPPLILDDPFVSLDTARQQRAMGILRRLSGSRQMIYFTCHDR